MLLQQGDVLIKSIDKLPENLSKVLPKENKLILAEGEATGHCHAISDIDNVELLQDKNGNLFLDVKEEIDLTHDEHNTITINPGQYEIDIVREYDHFEEEARKVED